MAKMAKMGKSSGKKGGLVSTPSNAGALGKKASPKGK